MLAVTSNFLAGTLTINLSGADTVALSAAGGNVQLSINGIGGFNPDSGVLQASNVSSIVVTGTGNFANTIDLTGVIASDYSALLAVSLNGGDGSDTYKIDQSILPAAAVVTVADTGLSGTDSLQLTSTGPGPETIGISDVSVSRSSGPAVGYSGLEQLTVNGTNAGDTINVTKTNANTATIVNAGSGLDTFGAIDLTQIGAAGLTLHAGGNGESLTLNTTTAGTVECLRRRRAALRQRPRELRRSEQFEHQRLQRRRHLPGQFHFHPDHPRRQRRRRYLYHHPHRPGRHPECHRQRPYGQRSTHRFQHRPRPRDDRSLRHPGHPLRRQRHPDLQRFRTAHRQRHQRRRYHQRHQDQRQHRDDCECRQWFRHFRGD